MISFLMFIGLAYAYYPGDIVDVYTVSPCQSLTVISEPEGLDFLDCEEENGVWHCTCVDNQFKLRAKIREDAQPTDYKITIQIFNPEKKEIVEKVVPQIYGCGRCARFRRATPTPTPTPSPSPTPTPTITPEEKPGEEIEEAECNCNALRKNIKTLENQLQDVLQKLNTCKHEREVMAEEIADINTAYNVYYEARSRLQETYEKCVREKTLFQITFIVTTILLLFCLYALFSRAEKEDKNDKDKKEPVPVPFEKPCCGGVVA